MCSVMQQEGEGTHSPPLKLRVPVLTGVLRSLSFHCVGKTAASMLLCNHTSQLQVLSQVRQVQSALQSHEEASVLVQIQNQL